MATKLKRKDCYTLEDATDLVLQSDLEMESDESSDDSIDDENESEVGESDEDQEEDELFTTPTTIGTSMRRGLKTRGGRRKNPSTPVTLASFQGENISFSPLTGNEFEHIEVERCDISNVDPNHFFADQNSLNTTPTVIQLNQFNTPSFQTSSPLITTTQQLPVSTPPTSSITPPVMVWTEKPANPVSFPFLETPGLKFELPQNPSPEFFAQLFFTDQLFNEIVHRTNQYAEKSINSNRPLRKKTRQGCWRPVTIQEMKKFVAILLHMGLIRLPTINHYWSTSERYKNNFCRNIMGRDRFLQILRYCHFCGSSEIVHRLDKIVLLQNHLNDTMKLIYTPDKSLSIDESMVLWRGRLVFRQYIKNKRHKYGVKFYELCTSSGIVLRTSIYCGIPYDDIDSLGQSAAIVLHLMKDFLDKGYALYTDNFYNSVRLTKELTKRKTYNCGTLQGRRKETPKQVVSKQLKKGEFFWQRSGNIVVGKWKDKKDVMVISNMHNPKLVETTNRRGQMKIKPNIVKDYNLGMSGIDFSDQMLSYNSSLRKTKRWYKKMGVHFFELYLHNAFQLFSETKRYEKNKMKFIQYREKIIFWLLGRTEDDDGTHTTTTVPNFHYLESIPSTEKKKNPSKPCQWKKCRDEKRRETRYVCNYCPNKPALCIQPCFKEYHMNVN